MLCFVCSIAGLIVSIIANKKSVAAGFTDNTPAKIGWIFTIVGFLVIIGYIIAFVALMNSGELTTY